MKPTFEKSQPNVTGPDFSLDEFRCLYQALNPAICPIRKD